MRKLASALIGVLLGCSLVTPLLAQTDCLQRHRIWTWKALDENTLLYTDRLQKSYTVTFRDRCQHVTRPNAVLSFRNAGSLSCIGSGDAISVKAPGYPGSVCRVDTVRAGAPGQAAG